MHIINIGGWYVGNSAILDWMDGFEELAYIKGDLNLLRLEDGIMGMISAEDSKKKLELISLQMHKIYLRIFVVSRKKVRRELRNLIKSNKIYPGTEDCLAYYFILIKYLKEYKSLIVKSARSI